MNYVREMISPQFPINEATGLKPINAPKDDNLKENKAEPKCKTYTIDYSGECITYTPVNESDECTCGLCAHPRGCIDSICHPKTAGNKRLGMENG